MKWLLTYGVAQVRSKVLLLVCLVWTGAATAEEITLLAFGDSLTQGYGLPPEDGFVPQLETALRDRGHAVTLINGGVSGDTTAGGQARVAWSLTPDVDAMIVNLGGNDVLRGIAPVVSRDNLRGILETAAMQGVAVLLVGMSAPGNYGSDYKEQFDRMFPELAEEFGAALVPNYFEGMSKAAGGDLSAAQQYFQSDGIHPTAEGVRLNIDAMLPAVEDLLQRAGG